MQALFARCDLETHLTLTAIHPTENKPVPSRHIRLNNTAALIDALEHLHVANALGWGAYFGLATRRPGLSRWQRGDMKALIEIPAIIADIDEAPNVVLSRVKSFPLPPSCIISSGHGLHLYWLLSEPIRDFQAVNAFHRGLAKALKGDYLTAATALRLPGSRNTKHSESTNCEILESDWSICYSMNDFVPYRYLSEPRKTGRERQLSHPGIRTIHLDPLSIQDVIDTLIRQGFKWRNTWLNGPCPYAHRHRHDDHRPSFGVNTATGYGYCFVCGTILPADLRSRLSASL